MVAAEVRTLAQRSANAAKDIKSLILIQVGKIRSGNELVDKSGSTMKEVVTAIKRVNDIMSEIAAASLEQASGIDEINKAINQMDEMTQQNAALVEQAAAASESLMSQAEQLNDHVSMFKIDESLHHSTRAAPTRKLPPTKSARSATKALPSKLKSAIKQNKPDDDDGKASNELGA